MIGYEHSRSVGSRRGTLVANLYVYVNSAVTSKCDPLGLDPVDVMAIPNDADDYVLNSERKRWREGRNGYDFIGYNTLMDLVLRLEKLAPKKGNDCIRYLEINAHGNTQMISHLTASNAGKWGSFMKSKFKFCCPCFIYLSGCNTGLGSGKMAQSLADSTGCTVFGSRGYLSGTHAGGDADTDTWTIVGWNDLRSAVEGSGDYDGDDAYRAFTPKGGVRKAEDCKKCDDGVRVEAPETSSNNSGKGFQK